MEDPKSNPLEAMWSQGLVPRIDGIVFANGKVTLLKPDDMEHGAIGLEKQNRTHTDLAALQSEGVEWVRISEMARLEMPSENLILISGNGEDENSGFVAVQEFSSRKLVWLAHFSSSKKFFTVKYGDDSLIADSSRYREWKFPLKNPEALSIGPSEEKPHAPPSPGEILFRKHYPLLNEFMETTLWPDVDGYNPIELLHQIAYYNPPEKTKKMIAELRALYADDRISSGDIASLFNRADASHPYQVVNEENAKDFCYSMQESLRFVASLKK